MKKYIKPESSSIRATCVKCGENQQSHKGNGLFRALCLPCHNERYPAVREYYRNYMATRRESEEYVTSEAGKRQRVGYKRFKKDHCEKCGFVAEHSCQLDIDHIDGNKANGDESNLQTLCANCHRLKTHQCGNFKRRKAKPNVASTSQLK